MTAAPEVCVGAIVVDDGRLLLVRRGRGRGRARGRCPAGGSSRARPLAEAVVRELAEETGLEGVCGQFVGWVERIGAEHHFVILDFEVDVLSAEEPGPATTPPRLAWVPLEDVAELRDLVDGLAEFLHEHGIIRPSPDRAPSGRPFAQFRYGRATAPGGAGRVRPRRRRRLGERRGVVGSGGVGSASPPGRRGPVGERRGVLGAAPGIAAGVRPPVPPAGHPAHRRRRRRAVRGGSAPPRVPERRWPRSGAGPDRSGGGPGRRRVRRRAPGSAATESSGGPSPGCPRPRPPAAPRRRPHGRVARRWEPGSDGRLGGGLGRDADRRGRSTSAAGAVPPAASGAGSPSAAGAVAGASARGLSAAARPRRRRPQGVGGLGAGTSAAAASRRSGGLRRGSPRLGRPARRGGLRSGDLRGGRLGGGRFGGRNLGLGGGRRGRERRGRGAGAARWSREGAAPAARAGASPAWRPDGGGVGRGPPRRGGRGGRLPGGGGSMPNVRAMAGSSDARRVDGGRQLVGDAWAGARHRHLAPHRRVGQRLEHGHPTVGERRAVSDAAGRARPGACAARAGTRTPALGGRDDSRRARTERPSSRDVVDSASHSWWASSWRRPSASLELGGQLARSSRRGRRRRRRTRPPPSAGRRRSSSSMSASAASARSSHSATRRRGSRSSAMDTTPSGLISGLSSARSLAFCSSMAWRTAGTPPRSTCSAMGCCSAGSDRTSSLRWVRPGRSRFGLGRAGSSGSGGRRRSLRRAGAAPGAGSPGAPPLPRGAPLGRAGPPDRGRRGTVAAGGRPSPRPVAAGPVAPGPVAVAVAASTVAVGRAWRRSVEVTGSKSRVGAEQLDALGLACGAPSAGSDAT